MKLSPRHAPGFLSACRAAARAYAATDRADPFLYGRTLAHLLNGILPIADVLADARARGSKPAALILKEAA